ncbi:MAG TPA: hypothetical protein VFY93_07120 [Planctomycetota bacterium]|nr:hypothetical protein [Planctomycetota bacterium]
MGAVTRARVLLAIACAGVIVLLLPVARRASRGFSPRATSPGQVDPGTTEATPETSSTPSAPAPDAAMDALLDRLLADGTTEAQSERAGDRIARLLRERPERIESCRLLLRETNAPRVMHALVVALTSLQATEAKPLVPDLLDAFDRTDDERVQLEILRCLVVRHEADEVLKRAGPLLLRGTSRDVDWTVGPCLAIIAGEHPERASEAGRIWARHLEREDIHPARFCSGLMILAELDPAQLRTLRPAPSIAASPLAMEYLEDAIREAEGR